MNKTYNFLNASPLWRAIKDNFGEIPMYLLFGIFGGIWGFWGLFFAIPLATFIKAIINSWPDPQNMN